MTGDHVLKITGVFPAEYLMIAKEQGIDTNQILDSIGIKKDINILRQNGISFNQMQKMMHALWEATQHDLSHV